MEFIQRAFLVEYTRIWFFFRYETVHSIKVGITSSRTLQHSPSVWSKIEQLEERAQLSDRNAEQTSAKLERMGSTLVKADADLNGLMGSLKRQWQGEMRAAEQRSNGRLEQVKDYAEALAARLERNEVGDESSKGAMERKVGRVEALVRDNKKLLENRLERSEGRVEDLEDSLQRAEGDMDGYQERLARLDGSLRSMVEAEVSTCERKVDRSVRAVEEKVEGLHSYGEDCASIKASDPSKGSGLYDVRIPGHGQARRVRCNMDLTGAGGATVILRRGLHRTYFGFERGWAEYARGFGNPEEEYWLGLDAVHALTARQRRNKLRIDMTAADGRRYHAVYEGFSVADSSTSYRLSLGNKVDGNAGDMMRWKKR